VGWRAVYDDVDVGVFGKAGELALVGAGCATQPDGGVLDDDEEEYSEPEMRNVPAWESHVWEVGEVLCRGVVSSCGSTWYSIRLGFWMASRSISSSHFDKGLDGVGVSCWAVSLLEEAIDKVFGKGSFGLFVVAWSYVLCF